MTKNFRVIDTGIRGCREQIAFDQALIETRKAGQIGDTVRFLQFTPSVLVGRHQAVSHELNLDACHQAGVEIGRRITGGGALYLDPGQFGWELIFDKSTLGIENLGDLAREICEAAAAGLSRLGVDVRYRPRNDLEVEGRKIGGTGGFFDGDTIFYQGTTLVEMDGAKMASLLNIPAAKLQKRGQTSGAQRIVTLTELFSGTPPSVREVQEAMLEGFAERLGIAPQWDDISQIEEDMAKALFEDEIGTDAFVYEIDDPANKPGVLTGSHTAAGGTITAHLRLEGPNRDRIRELLITGDFFVAPPSTIYNLEATLRGIVVSEVPGTVRAFFAAAGVSLLTAAPEDFSTAILNAVGQTEPELT